MANLRQPRRSLLDELLTEQAGVVSRPQLLAAGVSVRWIRTRLESGRWQRGYPGTYIAHNGDASFLSRVWSGLLYAGAGAITSHETAAFLHGVIDQPPRDIHVTVPSNRRVAGQPSLVVHLNGRAAAQEQFGSSPPRTTVEETVLDIVSTRRRPDDVVAVITGACQRRKTTASRLAAALALRKKMRHRALIEEALVAVAGGVHSVLEWRYWRDVEKAHGLPVGKRQAVRQRNGKSEHVDVDYDEYGVIVELDGEAYHDREQRAVDRARDRAAAVRGEAALRYGWPDVVPTPCAVAIEVATVLRRRGWKGTFRRCPRCPRQPMP